MESQKQNPENFWLRLDNAAKIFPAIRSTELTAVIRISVELTERVKARQFMEAIRAIGNRFPYYSVKLKPGFFWYYLEFDDVPVNVGVDSGIPCREFRKDEVMFRILVRKNRISVEFSHILTDGTGAFEFLKTLLISYFQNFGVNFPSQIHYLRPGEKASEEEFEDAYNRYFTNKTFPVIRVPEAFHIPFALKPKPRFSVLLGIIPVDDIVKKAKEFEVSLTEYLTAVYLYALQDVYKNLPERTKQKCPGKVRIEVPVNLRKMFPSKTMRNFSLYVMPEIDLRLGDYSFEEIVKRFITKCSLKRIKSLSIK